MQIATILVYGLFIAVGISIPVYIMFLIYRGAKSTTDAATTQKDIKHLLEELISEQKITNDLLREQKHL